MKPMLAGKFDPKLARFPVLASPKLDGIRCLVLNGVPVSRTLKLIPNRYVRAWFNACQTQHFEGLDGELIIGSPTHPDCYRTTVKGIMAHDGTPNFTFHVFDTMKHPTMPYVDRMATIEVPRQTWVRAVPQVPIDSMEDLDRVEATMLGEGYEGLMLRDPSGLYKFGRSSAREGLLLKVKRFEDGEAVVTGVVELLHNGNEARTNALGRTERSSHKGNKTGMETLGALVCEGLTAFPGVRFEVGTGFTSAERQKLWDNPPLARIIKFKYFAVGVKDKPRHPVFLGFRDADDMETSA